jgi:hypothetical protein
MMMQRRMQKQMHLRGLMFASVMASWHVSVCCTACLQACVEVLQPLVHMLQLRAMHSEGTREMKQSACVCQECFVM